ncbi:MAG: hypothetical protein OXQ84_16510 [bacterium]|nr:hypothetical protein [bacterium]
MGKDDARGVRFIKGGVQKALFMPFFTKYVEGVFGGIRNCHGSSTLSLGAGWPYKELWVDESTT